MADDIRSDQGGSSETVVVSLQRAVQELPGQVSAATKVEVNERMTRMEAKIAGMQSTVQKPAAMVEAFVDLSNGAIFRDTEGISERLPLLIDPGNLASLKKLPLYDVWMKKRSMLSHFAVRLLAYVLFDFSSRVPNFKEWVGNSVRTETRWYKDRLLGVSGLATML